MPDEPVDLGQVDAFLGTVIVEKAQLDPLGDLGEHRKAGANAIPGAAEWIGLARPDLAHVTRLSHAKALLVFQ
ncbi:hypothetical protein GCM10023334_070180 [Nonomuraea thailandensis]